MNRSKRRILAVISESIDTALLTGRAKRLPNPPLVSQLPDLEEIRSFRRQRLSPRIQAEITRLLSTGRNDVVVTDDLPVSPVNLNGIGDTRRCGFAPEFLS